ncbi:MAG: MATE family efflux transporter [Bacteroidales bacterium]
MNRKILALALPNIISSISVPFIGIVDMALMGRMPTPDYIGGVALGSLILNFIYWGFGFLRFGTSGFTSQALGRRDLKEAFHILVRSSFLGFACGLALLLLSIPLAGLGFRILHGQEAVEELGLTYFMIKILAAPASLVQFSMFGWFIGMQNSKIPMIVSLVANTVNILLSILFVTLLDAGIKGVAWGYVAGQYTGLGMTLLLYFRHFGKLSRYWNTVQSFSLSKFKEYMTVNRDIFVRTMCIIFVFSFFTAESAAADSRQDASETLLAVNSILMQFFMFFSFVIDGFAQAAEALAGRFIGAGDREKLGAMIKLTFTWSAVISLVFTISYITGGDRILRLLTDNSQIISNADPYRIWISAIPIVSFSAFLWDGIYIGATAGKAIRNSMLISTAFVFFPAWIVLGRLVGNHGLWIAFILFMLSRSLTLQLMARKAIFGRIVT